MSSPITTAYCLHCKASLPLDNPNVDLKQFVVNRLHIVGQCSGCKRKWSTFKSMPDADDMAAALNVYQNAEAALACYDTHRTSVKFSTMDTLLGTQPKKCECAGCVLRHNEKQALEENARKSLQGVTTHA